MTSSPPASDISDAIDAHQQEQFSAFMKEWMPAIELGQLSRRDLTTEIIESEADDICALLHALSRQFTGKEINVVYMIMAVRHAINGIECLNHRLAELKAKTLEQPKKVPSAMRVGKKFEETPEEFWYRLLNQQKDCKFVDPFGNIEHVDEGAFKQVLAVDFELCARKCSSVAFSLRLCHGDATLLPVDSIRISLKFLRLDLLSVHRFVCSYYLVLKGLVESKYAKCDAAMADQLGLNTAKELRNKFPTATFQQHGMD